MQKQPYTKKLEYRHYELPMEFPVVALLLGRYRFPPQNYDAFEFMHIHNCLEVGYRHQGNGILRVENQFIEFDRGDILIVPPFTAHITYRPAGNKDLASSEYLYFDPQTLLEQPIQGSLGFLDYLRHGSPTFPYVLKGGEHPEIAALVLSILDAMRYRREFYRQEAAGRILAFTAALARLLPAAARQDEAAAVIGTMQSLAPCMRFVNEHYNHPISPGEMAGLCHMSLTHFRRVFKKTVGNTPLDFIHQVRIRKAKELLYSTEASILDVSLAVGYESISGFNRHFVQITKTTPSKWRSGIRDLVKKGMHYSEFQYEEIPADK